MYSSHLEENETKNNNQYKTNNNRNLDIQKLLEEKRKNKLFSTNPSNVDNKDGDKLTNLLLSKRKQNTEETNDNPKDTLEDKTQEKKNNIDDLINKRLQEKLKNKGLENNMNKPSITPQSKESNLTQRVTQKKLSRKIYTIILKNKYKLKPLNNEEENVINKLTKCFTMGLQTYEHNFNCLKGYFEKWKIKSKESELINEINEIKKDEENINKNLNELKLEENKNENEINKNEKIDKINNEEEKKN